MSSGAVEMSFGIFDRLRLPEFSRLGSPTWTLGKYQRQRIKVVIALVILFCCLVPLSCIAETLECPEIGPGRVPDLLGDATGGRLTATTNRIDLANEINESINRLQIGNPDIPWNDVQNVLIAAYCRVVA